MAIAQVLRFPGGTLAQYDAIRREIGWTSGDAGKPDGLLAHAAGATDDGFAVIEWWNSEADWDAFFESKLQGAFANVGGIPQPEITRFDVHSSSPS